MKKSYKAAQFWFGIDDNNSTYSIPNILFFFLTNHLVIVDFWDEFAK